MIHPEYRELVAQRAPQVLAGAATTPLEIKVLRLDGSPVEVEAAGGRIEFDGSPAIQVVFRDITERKRAEETLRSSEDRYRQLFELESDAMLLVDNASGQYLEANAAAVALYGYSREELLSMNHTELSAEPGKTLQATAEHPTQIPLRWHKKRSGTVFPVEITTRYFDWKGRSVHIAAIRDVTERKQAEELLRLTQFSVDRAADSVFWTNSDGRLVYASDSTCRIHGYSRDEMLTMTLFDLDPSLSRGQWAEDWETIKERASIEFETVHRTKDGEIFPVEVNANYVEYEDKEYNCVFARDITKRKQAEEERLALERQFQQSQKLESLGVLAGGIAHDFNNILTSMLGNAELALCELSPAAPARENLLEITEASRRGAALCRQMLAYSGRGHFVTEPIDLSALVEDMLGLLKSTISKKALLNLNLEKDLPLLEGDLSQLSQVIMNLVINASEAIGEKEGVITISTGALECSREYLGETYAHVNSSPGFYLTLEVSDMGGGMDAATQERLFEPFYTTKFTGRGLGLAAVLGIVRGHKGALELESEPGKGTTFRVLLPASEAETGAPLRKTSAQTGDWQGEGTVLLVDDEETIRALGGRMLSRLGFEVLTAADGREALEVYREHRDEITLVLLDLTMPHMDGEETLRELRALDPKVRVVMSSGYTEQDITSRFADKGLVGFLQKPYTLAQLEERLRAALHDGGSTSGESAG